MRRRSPPRSSGRCPGHERDLDRGAARPRSGARLPRRPPGLGRRDRRERVRRPLCAGRRERPAVEVTGARRWSGGAQSVGLTTSDANGAAFTEVLLDGVPAAMAGNGITVSGEGSHVLRATARDGAGNETVVERALGVDASPPVIGEVTPISSRASSASASRMRSPGSRSPRWRRRHSARDADLGRPPHRVAHVPAGPVLDGATWPCVSGRASPPTSSVRSATCRARDAVLRGAECRARPHDRSGRRRRARRASIWAYPKGREPHLVGTIRPAPRGRSRARPAAAHDALCRCGGREPGTAPPGRARRRHAAHQGAHPRADAPRAR